MRSTIGIIAALLAGAWVGSNLSKKSLDALREEVKTNEARAEEHYRQLEALFSLHAQVKFNAPLPPMRRWSISPDFANLIVATVQQHQPRVVVELGGGISTIITATLLASQAMNGRVVAVDHLQPFADITAGYLAQHRVSEVARVICAPLTPIEVGGASFNWYATDFIDSLDAIDLLIVDGPAQEGSAQPIVRYPALPLLYDRLRDGALILMDDAKRPDETHVKDRWVREFGLQELPLYDTEKGAALLRKGG